MTNVESAIVQLVKDNLAHANDLKVSHLVRCGEGWSRESYSFELFYTVAGKSVRLSLVLRLDPKASLLTTDRLAEFRVLMALRQQGMNVPQVFWIDSDGSYFGRPGFLMEFVPGASAPEELYAPNVDAVRPMIGHQFFSFLGELHQLDVSSLGLDFLGPRTGLDPTLLAIEHWERVISSNKLEPQPVLHLVAEWLRENAPKAQRRSLLHGDFRSGNFLFDELGNITGFIDWELASVGDPLQDIGWAFMPLWSFESRICGLLGKAEALEIYENASGLRVNPEHLNYWITFSNFKLAAIATQSIRVCIDERGADIQYASSHLWLPRLLDEMGKGIGF